jgi:predicted Zn-dependent protease
MINSQSRGITLPALPMYIPGVFKRPAMIALTAGAIALAGCAGDQTGLGLSLVPEEQVEQMGLQTWQKLRSETPASQNRSYQQRLDRVATRILAAAGENPKAWEAVVFKGDQVNAFALPGGKIGFYEGMMELAESDAELAAVVGHEIAHNQEKHAVERVNSQAATQLGVGIAAAALGGQQANAVAGILNAGAQYGVLLPYGRNQELESDRQGLKYMARAGYNPNAAVTFWQKMANQSASRPPAFASTHPAPEQRIAQIKEMLPEARSIYQANR